MTSQLPSGSRFCKLYFNQDGIKRCGVAQVGKFFGSEDVYILSVRTEFGPKKFGGDHAGLHHTVYSSAEQDISAPIKHSHPVSICNPSRSRIRAIHFQKTNLLHLLCYWQVGESGIEEI